MRTTRTMQWVLLVVVSAAGCGSSFCARTAKLAEECGEPMSDADLDVCETSIEGCSAEDERKLTAFVDCAADLEICEDTVTETGDALALFGCLGELHGVSSECVAMMPTTPTTSDAM